MAEHNKEWTIVEKSSEKKILFLANDFTTLFWTRKELIQALLNEGHIVYLSFPESQRNDYFLDLGCVIYPIKMERRGTNPMRDLYLLYEYKVLIRKIQPDIIFSYTIKPNIYGSLANNGKYRQICNITGTGATFLSDGMLSRLCIRLYRISIKKAYKIFFQNTGDKDFFVKHKMAGGRYELISGSGCNLEEHVYSPMPVGDEVRFIFIGRIMALKGIKEFLECAKAIKEKYPRTKFYVAGSIEEPEQMGELKNTEKAGAIEYIGYRDDINEWIKKCHCTILPSHGGEGIPNVLLESGAMGRACIASDVPGSADVIEHGVTGYLFENKNSADLIRQVERFLQMPQEKRNEMGRAARKRIERLYDRKIIIEKYIQEIRDLDEN